MKKSFSLKRLLACLLLLVLIPASALAEEYKAKVTSSKMNIYSTNRVGNNFFLGSLGKGVEFTVTATSGAWARISYQGRTGFAKLSDMEKIEKQTVVETNYKAEVKGTTMKVYSTNAVSDDNLLGTLKKGDVFTVTATSGDWARISYNGRTGFAKLSGMQKVTEKVVETNYAAEVKSTSMKVYSTNAVSNDNYLGSLKKGVEFTVTATSGDWARISYNGRIGFAKLSDMRKVEVKVVETNYKAEVKSAMMKVYSTNTVSDDYYLGQLKKGIQFTVTATLGDWAYISYQGRTGFAKLSDMQKVVEKVVQTNYKAEVSSAQMKVYSKNTAADANFLGSLKKGVEFTVTATSGDWARISYQNRIGYAKLSDMKKVVESVDWTEYKAEATADKMYVYSTNSAETKYRLGHLNKGVEFTVVATSGGWARITHQGRVGFAKLSDMKKVETAEEKPLVYSNRMTKIYTSANTNSKVLDTITADFPMYVIGTSGNFYKVSPKDGTVTGYVRKAHVGEAKVNALSVSDAYKGSYSSSNSTSVMPGAVDSTQYALAASMAKSKYIEYIIYAAQSRLGCRYSAEPNNTTTFRNLSYVRTCFKTLDITTPASFEKMSEGTKIAYNNLKRGDIVCFDCDYDGTVDHVGIYLGSDYFIHASNAAGMVVVSKMGYGFYKETFEFGRRVIA